MLKIKGKLQKHLIGVLLFKYYDVFEDGKVRPGFSIDKRVFVLTHTYPGTELSWIQPVEICSDKICEKTEKSYLIETAYQLRASNTTAGYATFDPRKFKKSFGVLPEENHFFIL